MGHNEGFSNLTVVTNVLISRSISVSSRSSFKRVTKLRWRNFTRTIIYM